VQKVKPAEIVAAAPVPRAVKQGEFMRLRGIAERNGYKPGWVGARFKERFGHWPRGLS